MTITELLAKLTAAFPAFNARATEAWASVFRARLGRHEGPALAQAYEDTLGAFSVAKSKSLFPVPADFEPHLPQHSLKLAHSSPRLDLVGHAHLRKQLLLAWWKTQGIRIKDARGRTIARACEWEVEKLASATAWNVKPAEILLTAEQINICEERAVSSERLATFGPYSLRRPSADRWLEEMATARETVRRAA